MKTTISTLAALLLLGATTTSVAQEEQEEPTTSTEESVSEESASDELAAPARVGPYTINGSLSAGSRFAGVSGLEGRTSQLWADRLFREQSQLDPSKVAPTFSLNLFGDKPRDVAGAFDQAFLNASYDGANVIGSLRFRSFGLYDLKVRYTRSTYFFDRYDSVFSDLRSFDQARGRFNASLTVTPVDMLDVQVSYSRNERSGSQTIPRTPFLEIPTVPAAIQWAGYARANFFPIAYPTSDVTNRFEGRLTARLPLTSMNAGGGYRSFTDDIDGSPAGLTSLNVMGDSAAGLVNDYGFIGTSRVKEPLSAYRWTERRESSGPFAFGQIVFRPIDMVSATASVDYQKAEGTTTVDAIEQGTMRKNSAGSQLTRFQASYAGAADEESDRTNASLSLALIPITELQIVGSFQLRHHSHRSRADYRGTLDTSINGEVQPLFATALPDSMGHFVAETDAEVETRTLTADIVATPIRELVVRAGIRRTDRTPELRRHIEHELDSAYSSHLSRESGFTTLTGSVFARPFPELRIRARVSSVHGTSSGASVTEEGVVHGDVDTDIVPRRTPLEDLSIAGSVDLDPFDELSFSVSASFNEGENGLTPVAGVTISDQTPFELTHDGRSFAARVGLRPIDGLELSLGSTYDESNLSIPMTWARASAGGTLLDPYFGDSPVDSLTTIVEERTIDRMYSAAATVTPFDGLTIGAAFDYLRSTGGSAMSPDVLNPARLTLVKSDATRMNGPMTRWTARASVAYDIIPSVGIALDALFINQEEDLVGAFVALNNYKANVVTLSLIYTL